MSSSSTEFTGHEMQRLLGLLDSSLQQRGIAAAVYVVGGAAIALSIESDRRTRDIDVLATSSAVLEEARKIAINEKLAPGWLNQAARPWIPAPSDLSAPEEPGLKVIYAPPEHLLAMKLIAMRRQDVPDIVALARRMEHAERHRRRVRRPARTRLRRCRFATAGAGRTLRGRTNRGPGEGRHRSPCGGGGTKPVISSVDDPVSGR
ncbi:DUF6036 family nucleotidyltransferase [Kineosporia sp. NBRC 101731]|uniref:DUF6036 family nucleotidyltransferase n=1 Tax=Kineosporia sp. NBRC 101731 TaxID=3032199 RepID=UPI0033322C40